MMTPHNIFFIHRLADTANSTSFRTKIWQLSSMIDHLYSCPYFPFGREDLRVVQLPRYSKDDSTDEAARAGRLHVSGYLCLGKISVQSIPAGDRHLPQAQSACAGEFSSQT